jgi:hypothetical protein
LWTRFHTRRGISGPAEWLLRSQTEQVGLELRFKTCIRELFGSNLGRDMGYPEWGFFVVLLSPSRQMPGQYLD